MIEIPKGMRVKTKLFSKMNKKKIHHYPRSTGKNIFVKCTTEKLKKNSSFAKPIQYCKVINLQLK